MKSLKHLWLCPILLTSLSVSNAVADSVLWYNGDYAGASGTVNELSTDEGAAYVYDDFNVTAGGGWTLDRIWSNDDMNLQGVTSASWSIRSGMSSGNGGTVIASGTSSATQTATGRTSWWGFPEYTISVSGLNVHLSPGTYWLSVSPLVGNDPLSNGYYYSYVSQTSGLNAVGTPAGNDGNSFEYDPAAGDNFTPDRFNEDYSMGVAGVAIAPEPSAWGLIITGLLLGWLAKRKSVRNAKGPVPATV